MRFVIMGTGGIGGFFGARLAAAGEDVWFIARGKHLDVLKHHGLRINSTAGTFNIPSGKMTDDIASIGPADVILFCVKSYDTEAAAKQLSPILKDDSLIIPLQNGVDSGQTIRRSITRGDVYGGVAYISSRITAPGEITEVGGFQRIVFGPQEPKLNVHASAVHEALLRAGIKSQVQDDITKELWRKLIFIASMGSLTALSRLTHGEILGNPQTVRLMFDAMREAESVAWKLGVDIEPVDETRVLEGLKRFSDDTRSSMYFDLIAGKPLEIEALNGTIVRLGERLGVPTPVHRVIFSVLLPHHLMHSKEHTPK
jgi:2-dehydropantoate 2-reductase